MAETNAAPVHEPWECGPHANVWNGHDARCRRVEATIAPMPTAPEGFVECRVGAMRAGDRQQITHLVLLDSAGSNGGRPTMCGLTRFPTRDPKTGRVMLEADLPGWSMGGGGVTGPGVEQVKCRACWARVGSVTR